MSNVWKIVGMVVGGLFLFGAITAGFFFFTSSKEQAGSLSSKMATINESLSSIDVDMYDGTVVSGSEVLNAINKFKSEEMSIQVKTKASSLYYYYNYSIAETDGNKKLTTSNVATLQSARTKGKSNYINPLGHFNGSIIRDSNDTIIGIRFEQY